MSADYWAICPRCLKRARKADEIREQSTAELMKKLSEAERKLISAVTKPLNPEDYRTLREDYEFYVTEAGVVEISYSGHCTQCGFGIDFEDKREIPGMDE